MRRSRWARRIQFDDLEGRQLMVASLAPIANVTIPQFLSLPIPLDGGAENQTYSITSSNEEIDASIIQGRFLTLTVNHASSGPNDPSINNETLVFQLFDELTPLTVSRIEQLVNSGFYNGKIFHRIAANFPNPTDFIVQGGSVNGDGTGEVPLPGFPFEDEFVPGLAFTGEGQLAMANAGRDTNSSQFFATTGSPRFLDYIHTIFGQLVAGQSTLDKITQIPRNASDGPTPNPVTITNASLVNVSPEGTALIDATQADIGDTATIQVTARSSVDGTTATRQFQATVAANSQNQRPFFVDVPENITVARGQTATFRANIHNPESADVLTFQVNGGRTGSNSNPTFTPVQNATATIDNNGVVTVTPNAGFTGTINLLLAVRDQVNRATGNGNFDTEALTITVQDSTAPVNLAPIANNVNATASVNSPTQIRLSGNSANTGQGLVFSVLTQPANGVLTSLDPSTGVLTYTPNPGFTGSDTFTYQVRDIGDPTPNLTSSAATVSITVNSVTGTVRLIPPVDADDPADTERVLVVNPSPKNRRDRTPNNITVFKEGTNIRVRINGVVDMTTVAESSLTSIQVYGAKASDRIMIDPAIDVPATLNGGQGGKNTIKAGNVGSRLHGWFGQNTLQGGTGQDALIGRQGRVKFLPSAGDDLYFAGDRSKYPERNGHNPEAPDGRFFRFRNGKFVEIHPRGPRFTGLRQDHQIGGDFLNL